MNELLLCVPPPPWTRVRGVAHKVYVWNKQPLVPHWCDIHVRFMGGSPWQRETVQGIVEAGWNRASGAQFVFSDSYEAPVRVSFEPGASWSQPGNYGLNGPFDLPTMNLGWIRDDYGEEELRRVTAHEFGHALALQHEHAHPWAAIPWDLPKVYAYYRRTNGWPREVVDAQVLTPLAEEMAVTGAYDAHSVMGYALPAELLTDATFATGRNTTISAGDVAMVRALYGPPPAQAQHMAFFPVARR